MFTRNWCFLISYQSNVRWWCKVKDLCGKLSPIREHETNAIYTPEILKSKSGSFDGSLSSNNDVEVAADVLIGLARVSIFCFTGRLFMPLEHKETLQFLLR